MTELVLPWLPEGRLFPVQGRGELFARVHRHADPDAPVVLLLHGWTASADLQFAPAYEGLTAHYTVVGIDHRGHGRGLRSPDAFTLEDAADDAAALLEVLGVGPVVTVGYSMGGPVSMLLARRHPQLVRGLVVQATALDFSHTLRDRLLWRVLPIAGSWLRSRGYRRYLNRTVPKFVATDGEQAPALVPYVPWLVSEMSRNDAFAMVEAGRALSRYDARPWASHLGKPAGSLVTTVDQAVSPSQQYALAAALGAHVREIRANHFVPLTHPAAYTEATIELIDDVHQRSSAAVASSSVA